MIQYILYRIGLWVSVSVPLKVAYKIAKFFAVLQYRFCFRDRRAVMDNLSIIMATFDEKVLRAAARQVFINFAKYLVDFFRFSLVDKNYVDKLVRVEGRQNIDEALKKGNGVIAMTAHVGNWELSAVITAFLGYPVNVIVLSHKHKRINDFFVGQRESKGIKVVPVGVAVRKCFAALKENELIGVAGDRDFTGTGVTVKFLGKDVKMPKGPALFSLKTEAPIIPSFMIRQDDDTYRMFYQRPIDYTPTGNDDEDIAALTGKCAQAIEGIIRQYPTQWFMFRQFWKEDANKV